MRQDFDRDRTKPNPYEEPEACKSSQEFLTVPALTPPPLPL